MINKNTSEKLLIAGTILAFTALGFVLGFATANFKKARLGVNDKGELIKDEVDDEREAKNV